MTPIRRALALAPLAAALATVPLEGARAQRAVTLSAAAGATAPLGTTGNFLKAGYHAQAAVDVHVRGMLGVRLEGAFHEMDFERDATSNKLRVTSGVLDAVYASSRREGPYLVGGLGAYKIAPTNDNLLTSVYPTGETKLGANLGVGIRFAHSGFSTFFEIRFHRVFDDEDTQFLPISFGITF